MAQFQVLPGFYNILFLHIEPCSTILPAVLVWLYPGAAWFHNELIPSPSASADIAPQSVMAIWQLGNCYFLLGLLSSLVFRAVRDALPHNQAAQERILGASFTAMAIADATHILATLFGLPDELKFNPTSWNPTTHGNITFVVFLLVSRMAWFLGVGRTRFYYGQLKRSKNA